MLLLVFGSNFSKTYQKIIEKAPSNGIFKAIYIKVCWGGGVESQPKTDVT